MLGTAVHEQVVGPLDPLPPPIAVHRVIAPDDAAGPAASRRLHPPLHLCQKACPGRRQRVAPVGEGVQDEVWNLERGAELDQGPQMAEARVDAAVGHQPDQVDALGSQERLSEHRVGGQLTALHGLVDSREILYQDRSGSKIQMADLGVAHLALREPHSPAASL